jgi:hypothetical protein
MDRSSGLALEWDERAASERGVVPSKVPSLFIVNRSDSMWECDGDEFWAFVSVFDARSGKRLPSHGVAIGGGGRTYRLLPPADRSSGCLLDRPPGLAVRSVRTRGEDL